MLRVLLACAVASSVAALLPGAQYAPARRFGVSAERGTVCVQSAEKKRTPDGLLPSLLSPCERKLIYVATFSSHGIVIRPQKIRLRHRRTRILRRFFTELAKNSLKKILDRLKGR